MCKLAQQNYFHFDINITFPYLKIISEAQLSKEHFFVYVCVWGGGGGLCKMYVKIEIGNSKLLK